MIFGDIPRQNAQGRPVRPPMNRPIGEPLTSNARFANFFTGKLLLACIWPSRQEYQAT